MSSRSVHGHRLEARELRARLGDAASLRAPLHAETSALRLVNGEGDGLPGLTVDLYDRFTVLNVYDPIWLDRLEELGALLLERGAAGVYLKRRVKGDLRAVNQGEVASDRPLCGVPAPDPLVVHEGQLKMAVFLGDGLSTGLFVDQRDNHLRCLRWGAEGRMLNLFCYTAAFSVAAAQAGASTTNVDLSAKALSRSRDNFLLNGLDPSRHRFFKEDAVRFLRRAVRRKERYSLIVLDPPSFSTVGKSTFSVKGRYREAAALCISLLAPGGKLLCVTNHIATSPRQLKHMLRGASEDAKRPLSLLKDLPSGMDCPAGASGPFPSKSVLVQVDDGL